MEDRTYATLIDIAIGVSLTQAYSLTLSMIGWIPNFLFWILGGNYSATVNGGYWAIVLGWWGWQWSLRGRTGQSVGQRIIGIRVVDEETRKPIGPVRSIVRSLTHAIDALPLCAGYIRPSWDRQRQTWADKIHHTIAINAATEKEPTQ
ncbi:RDD family protein [Streptomyces sp. VTCC 41912]|uniref:RDD family protein n=1 Tax=Streptomyces sp. VTCC 41912 TaxID=3383243 RepID=UPI003896CB00